MRTSVTTVIAGIGLICVGACDPCDPCGTKKPPDGSAMMSQTASPSTPLEQPHGSS